ncbi:MAG: STAS domain-containing protein [Corynebacteriales bacterium]|nr:STAS domain-containing protein [Mycobacteriales bacterium]
MELSLNTRQVGVYSVLEVGGEIDVYTAPALRDQLVELADSGASKIVVDLEGVEFLDSTGLGVLVGALKRAQASGGILRLVSSQERILKIFRITGLEQVFGIAASVQQATSGQNE